MSDQILLVEDDKSICDMVSNYLLGEGFTVEAIHNGKSAIPKFSSRQYDLVLLDLMLPDISGMEVLKAIRETSTVPIIILTAKDNDTDKSLGLNLGADDYVVKPFSLIELTARIKANIRRAVRYDGCGKETVIRIRDLEIHTGSHTVLRKGENLNLTRTEFEILRLLASSPERAFSKEMLYELVWKEPYYGNENVLNTHMNRLRAKLKAGCQEDLPYIKTLWGIGYRMEDGK